MATSGNSERRVVITGVGVVSPIGVGIDDLWASLQAGQTGVAAIPMIADTVMPVRFGAMVTDFEPKQLVKPRKSLKVMSREIQFGYVTADFAMEHSRLAEHEVDPDRFGVVYGCGMLYCDIDELEDVYRSCITEGEFDFSQWGDRAMSEMYPLWMLKYLPNMVACHIGISHDARGPNNTATIGDASSLMAVIEAARVIQRGHADVMLAGGSGSRISLTPWMFRGDAGLSHRNDDPAAACRPFDANRDGMVNGEGAATIVLETLEHAQARKAPVLAELVGMGLGFEPSSGQAVTGSGIRHAMVHALQEAELTPADLDHVKAHGLSMVDQDAMEAAAISDTLGAIPVTAPKSFFGNMGTGGGAVELVVSLLALQNGQVPATLNYTHPDPACPIDVVHGQPREMTRDAVMAINYSTPGQAAAVVIRKPA